MRVAVFLLFPAILAADTLELRSGPPVNGTYAGGDARSIRFIVGDQVKTFPVSDVVSVHFDNPGAKQTPSSSEGLRTLSEAALPSKPDVAEKQRKFCEVISDYRDVNTRYANEPNPIKKADMRKPDPYDFEPRIVDLLGESGRFENWTGTVRFHVDGSHIAASFFPDCKGFPQAIEFATAGHYVLLSSDSSTMIPLHSSIGDTLSRASGNQTVVASGHLFYLAHGNLGSYQTGQKAELRQRYKNEPNYPPASAASPRYLASFDSMTLQH